MAGLALINENLRLTEMVKYLRAQNRSLRQREQEARELLSRIQCGCAPLPTHEDDCDQPKIDKWLGAR